MSALSGRALPAGIKSGLRALFRSHGYQIEQYERSVPYLRNRLLLSHGIDLMIDVGANRGQFVLDLRTHGYKGKVVSFEPLKGPFTSLMKAARRDPDWDVHRLAIGAARGVVEMRVASDDRFSSALEMTDLPNVVAGVSALEKEQAQIDTLDNVLSRDLNGDTRMAVKIDVQGFEGEVILGGSHTLSQTLVLEIELPLSRTYVGETSLMRRLQEIYELGFHQIALVENEFIDVNSGVAHQLNAVFVRPSNP